MTVNHCASPPETWGRNTFAGSELVFRSLWMLEQILRLNDGTVAIDACRILWWRREDAGREAQSISQDADTSPLGWWDGDGNTGASMIP